MRKLFAHPILWIGLAAALSGCGGSSGGNSTPTPTTIKNATFQISWPARSRSALTALSSAQSVSVVFPAASTTGTDINLKVDRDTTKLAAYTGTYTLTDTIKTSVTSLTATFYAQVGEQGAAVGTATAQIKWGSSSASLASIVVAGSIKHLVAIPTTLTMGSTATQLQFTATDTNGSTVAVSPGSSTWTLVKSTGTAAIKLTADGMVTPLAVGTAQVTASVDGVASPNATITVAAKNTVSYASFKLATTASIFSYAPSGAFGGYLKTWGNGVYGASLTATDTQLQVLKVPSGYNSSFPRAVNNLGNIAGEFAVTTQSGTTGYAPCYWSSPTATAIPLTIPTGETSEIYPMAISKSGAIVGRTPFSFGTGLPAARVYLWPTPTSKPITLRPFSSQGYYTSLSVSDTGQVVIQATDQGTLLYTAPYTAAPTQLLAPDGSSGRPLSIGPNGTIFGTDNANKGFYMLGPSSKGVYLPGTDVIYSMNSLGQACGMSDPGGGNFSDALFWTSVTATPELVPSGSAGNQAISANTLFDDGTMITGDDYGNYYWVKRTPA